MFNNLRMKSVSTFWVKSRCAFCLCKGGIRMEQNVSGKKGLGLRERQKLNIGDISQI